VAVIILQGAQCEGNPILKLHRYPQASWEPIFWLVLEKAVS
jgi:hypothetical protein